MSMRIRESLKLHVRVRAAAPGVQRACFAGRGLLWVAVGLVRNCTVTQGFANFEGNAVIREASTNRLMVHLRRVWSVLCHG